MKKILCIVLFFNLLQAAGSAGPQVLRTIQNNSFFPEEKLTFELKWGFITGGFSSMEVLENSPINGNPVWKILTKAWSTGFVHTFFKVADKNESWIDSNGIFSYRFRKEINEGDYHKIEETIYDYTVMKAIVPGRGETDIEPFTHDILSAFYFIRAQKLEPGQEYNILVTTELKKWRLKVKVLKRTAINSYFGLTPTIMLEPILIEEGIFSQKGTLKIWVTDDELHLPVRMASKVFIGSIVADLVDFNGVRPGAAVSLKNRSAGRPDYKD